MKIQLINSSKLKIIFNKFDLDENNISLHSFLSNSSNSQNFIKAIIEIAYEDFGFKTENSDFVYEIYCFDFSEFIIIVYNNIDINKNSYIPQNLLHYTKDNFSRERSITHNFSFKFDNNNLFENKNLFFFFSNFEGFLNFSEYIKNNLKLKNINSSLYEYNNIFLLEIITSTLLPTELTSLQSILLESKLNSYPFKLTLVRFKEFAKVVYSENALNL